MNIGQKITLLKDGAGFKNYKEFGDFVGLSNDWCLELSKKQEITSIDVTRLMLIATKFNVSIDWLLADIDGEDISSNEQFPEDDIASMLNKIQSKIANGSSFEGTPISKDISKLAYDGIDVVKKLIRQNL